MLNKFLRENKVSKMTKAERNAWYNSLTKPQKAVAICEDVLLQIKNEKYLMESGSYISLNIAGDITQRTVKDIFKKTALDEVVASKSITCNVCAMGSCLMSAVRLGNQVEVTDIMDFYPEYLVEDDFEDIITKPGEVVSQADSIDWTKLKEAFTVKEYRAMEFIFENGKDIDGTFGESHSNWYRNNLTDEQQTLRDLYNSEYSHLDSTEKMQNMCKQIIKANGYFLIEGIDLENTNK